jgi:hypothetical protein
LTLRCRIRFFHSDLSVKFPLSSELAKLNESRKMFDNLSSSLSDALAKKAAINKSKAQELQDAKNALTGRLFVGRLFYK